MKAKEYMFAVMLIALLASPAFAGNYISITSVNATTNNPTNYTVGGQLYFRGSQNVTIKVTSDVNDTIRARYAQGANVTLNNLTDKSAGNNVTWLGTYILPSSSQYTNFTAVGNNTIATTGLFNTTMEAGIDAVPPVSSDDRPTSYARGRPGDVLNFSVRVVDAVSVNGTVLLDFTSVPTGSAVADVRVRCPGATNSTCNTTVTIDVVGDYTFRWVTYDNVTGETNGSSVTYSHLRVPDLPPAAVREQQAANAANQMQILPEEDIFSPVGKSADVVGGFAGDLLGGFFNLLFGWIK